MVLDKHYYIVQATWGQIQGLPHSCMTLDKLFQLSLPQCLRIHWDDRTYFTEL